MPCVTLVSIIPDGTTTTKTFSRDDLDAAAIWVAAQQGDGRNVYFQPNETQPGCIRKPGKEDIVAIVSRFADIDPADDRYPLAEERDRLGRLAEDRRQDPIAAPTAIINSGNGLQFLWAVTRETVTDEVIDRAERETKAIEVALGAGGTHNVDRLLRLPGTVNFPNAKKRALKREISRARLIFSAPTLYPPLEAAGLARHLTTTLAETDLVRPRAQKVGPTKSDDADVLALVNEMEAAEATRVTHLDHLPEHLRTRLLAALQRNKRMADRWSGVADDLAEAGRDASRSGMDLSLAAMAKGAGFSHLEASLILCAFAHGKANQEKWSNDGLRMRHVARTVLRSFEPKSKGDWPSPIDFLADAEMTGSPELKREHLPEAIVPFVFDTAARMGVDPAAVALPSIVSLASVIDDEWCIQPKQNDYTWTENPRIWEANVGDPSMLKTPILKAVTAPIDRMEAEAREQHEHDMRRYKSDMKIWKDSGGDPTSEPPYPRLKRYMVEGTTVEAITEVLRNDAQAKQIAPANKVLIRQDEMSEWIAGFDRYRSGGKGGADRGAYLRLYNGGRWTVDRIGRGTFAIPNWSACVLGGIQPGPIRQIAREASDDGLLQRFCYCVPADQRRGEDRRPDGAGVARYEAVFPALAAMHPVRDSDGGYRHVCTTR